MKINPDHIYMPDGVYEIVDTEHGKGLKKVLGFVAAIAIPFAAPMIAGAMGLSTALTGALGMGAKLATTAASALTGAGLGAAKAAIMGENVGQGALGGAIGGGLGGFSAAGKAAQAGLNTAGTTTSAGLSTAASPGLASQVSNIGGTLGVSGGALATPAATALTASAVPGAVAAPSLLGTIKGALATTGSFAKAQMAANPDFMLKAGSQLASAAMTSGRFAGMSSAEKRAYIAQQEELKQRGELNKQLFAQQQTRAQQAMNDANRIDPFGRAQQAANMMRVQGDVVGQEAARRTGFTQRAGLNVAEARRAQLDAAEKAAGRFDQVYDSSKSQQIAQRNAALGLFATQAPSGTAADQLALEEANRKRREELQAGLNTTAGYLFGNSPMKSTSTDAASKVKG
jgi:hypothetical protein